MPPWRRANVAVDLCPRRVAVEGGRPPLTVRDQLDEGLVEDDGRLVSTLRGRPGSTAQPDAVLVLAEVAHDLVPVEAAVIFRVDHAHITICHGLNISGRLRAALR